MTKRQESQHSPRVDRTTASQTKTWIDRELVGSEFRDARLNKRFRKLFEQPPDGIGESIPLVCQDWANTKAAYRFLSNQRVSEARYAESNDGRQTLSVERRREERPGERTGLVRKVAIVTLSEIAGDAGAPFAAFTSGLATTHPEPRRAPPQNALTVAQGHLPASPMQPSMLASRR